MLFSCRNQYAGTCELVLQSTFSAHCPFRFSGAAYGMRLLTSGLVYNSGNRLQRCRRSVRYSRNENGEYYGVGMWTRRACSAASAAYVYSMCHVYSTNYRKPVCTADAARVDSQLVFSGWCGEATGTTADVGLWQLGVFCDLTAGLNDDGMVCLVRQTTGV